MFAWGYEAWRWMFWVELAPAFLFLFAFFAFISAFFVIKYTHETKGLELDDMKG